MSYQLRDYQENAVSNIINFIMNPENKGKNPLADLCVGSGKSVMIAEVCSRLINYFPDLKILSLVHTKELVEQNEERFRTLCPHLTSSVFMGTLGKKDTSGQVIFGSIQSVAKEPDLFSPHIIMVDECHWIQKKSSGMYRAFIENVHQRMPNTIIIGWTGTIWRMDGGSLIDGSEKLFDEVVAKVKIRELLDLGFLSPLVVPRQAIQTKYDTSSLQVNNGDFNESLMAELLDDDVLIQETVEEYYRLSKGRKKHLIFGTRKKHCQHLKEAFSKHFKVEFIHGSMRKKDREKFIKQFREGELDMLVSGIVLTTGFDVPDVDCIGLCRDVASSALYVQIAGRGLRKAEGKLDCLWIDFTETTSRHGPVDQLEPPPFFESDGNGEAVCKFCPQCTATGEPFKVPASTRICPQCEYEFPIESIVAHKSTASDASVISEQPELRLLTHFNVERYMSQSDRAKKNAIAMKIKLGQALTYAEENFVAKNNLKFTFTFGLSSYTKIVCFDDPKTRHYACSFWSAIVKEEYKNQCPKSAEAALTMINDMKAMLPIKEMRFTYSTHYNGKRGKTKLSSPRLDDILDIVLFE